MSLEQLTVAASLLIMLMTANDTALSGIFLVLLIMPWSLVLKWIQDTFHLNSMAFNGFFMAASGLLNSFILYTSTSSRL